MKTISTAFIFLLLISNLKAQWFWQNSSLPEYELISIGFVDSNYGWIVGYDYFNNIGLIYRTTNGGTNWDSQIYSDFWGLSSVKFVDSLTGWAVGQNNPDTALSYGHFIYKSTNGGNSWFRQFIPNDRTLWAVDFVNLTIGWAVGGGTIIKTSNGGSSWESKHEDSVFFNSVDFVNSNTGWVVGWGDLILKTTDGGSNWIYQRSELGRRLNSVKFIDENTGWTVGDSGRIFKTTNGGTNWLIQRDGTQDLLFSVSFVDENNGWVAGKKTVGPIDEYILLKTTDGGSTWENESLPNDPLIYAVHFIDHNTGWVSGHSGTILKTTTGGVIPVDLISFDASLNGSTVKLNWTTATETNNKGFEIQRSSPPLNPLQGGENNGWKKIGFVAGNGTTTEPKSYSFTDDDLPTGIYSYRLKQIDFDGSFEYSNIAEVEIGLPDKFVLYQNYPNPFNPVSKIKYSIPSVILSGAKNLTNVSLKVYDILGKEVAVLVNEFKPAGVYEVEFNAVSLSSGIYFYRLKSGKFTETKKLLLLK